MIKEAFYNLLLYADRSLGVDFFETDACSYSFIERGIDKRRLLPAQFPLFTFFERNRRLRLNFDTHFT